MNSDENREMKNIALTTSCSPNRKGGCPPDRENYASLEEIVLRYQNDYQETVESEVGFYCGLGKREPFKTVVATAARCELANGKRHPHQHRIRRCALEKVEAVLCTDHALSKLAATKDFESLHKQLCDMIFSIPGIGELTVYDIATRIGISLGHQPQWVYLHAGVRGGAKALGLDVSGSTLSASVLPEAFHVLTPAQIEDCLCIFKEALRKFSLRHS